MYKTQGTYFSSGTHICYLHFIVNCRRVSPNRSIYNKNTSIQKIIRNKCSQEFHIVYNYTRRRNEKENVTTNPDAQSINTYLITN